MQQKKLYLQAQMGTKNCETDTKNLKLDYKSE